MADERDVAAAVERLAILRRWPWMRVLEPADAEAIDTVCDALERAQRENARITNNFLHEEQRADVNCDAAMDWEGIADSLAAVSVRVLKRLRSDHPLLADPRVQALPKD